MNNKKINRTLEELFEIDALVGRLYKKDKELENTKFGYAYRKFYKKNTEPILKELQEKLSDIRVENALENKETREIIIDKENSRGYKYDKEGLKKCIKEERKVIETFNKKEVEIEPYFSSFVPKQLEEEEKELLKNLVIK